MRVHPLLSLAKKVAAIAMAGIIHTATASEPLPFERSWESLSRVDDAPEWMKDAKFGVYTHWGPQTEFARYPVPGSLDYYANMYKRQMPTFEFHRNTFGDHKTVGYKDILNEFKAPEFNAEFWAETFHNAGARFAGMVVLHHDNVPMWDSILNPYNVKNLGPKRDITGELEKAYRQRGMKFLTTFHNLASWTRSYIEAYEFDGSNPEAVMLYN